MRIDFREDFGRFADRISIDMLICRSDIALRLYDADGEWVDETPLKNECWKYLPYSWELDNGISALEWVGRRDIEGNSVVDNVTLEFE